MSAQMGKIEILTAICETPGWQPPSPSSSRVDAALGALHLEGWIVPRLDGWEASPKAVDFYPHFHLDEIGRVEGVRTLAPPEEIPIKESERIVATVMLDGVGYEVMHDNGRFRTAKREPGAVSPAFGHYDSLRLLVRVADLLGRQ